MRKLLTSLFLLPLVCLAIDQGSTRIRGTLTVDSAVSFTQTVPITSGGTGANSASSARTNLGLGTAAVLNSTAFDAAGAALSVEQNLDTHKNLTGSNVHGLGTISTQAANNVAITGGSVTGITDLAVADGGTGSSTAAAAIVAIGGKAANGFVDRTNSTLGMSGSTFQITTSGSYDFYSAGTKFTKSTTQSVSISSDLTLSYVYFDTSGVLQVSAGTAWSITSDNVPVATVYRDGSFYIISDERHGWKRDRDWHAWAHETVGTRWHTGLAIQTITDTAVSFTSGEVDDEDIHHSISTQLDSPRIWFRNSTTSMKVRPSSKKPYASLSGTDIAYDNAGTLTQVTNNNYVNSYFFATNDQSYPIYVVVGQNQHNTIAAARAEALPTIQLPSAEWKLLYKAIYKSNGASAPTYQEAADYRTTQTLALTATATDHQSLANRDVANSHPQAAITGLTTSDSTVFTAIGLGGTTTPTQSLDVRGNIQTTGRANWATTGDQAWLYIGDSNNRFGGSRGGAIAIYGDYAPLEFGAGGGVSAAEDTKLITLKTGGTERMRIDSSGNVTISTGGLFVSTSKTPEHDNSAGTTGQIAWDTNYIYICVGTGAWKRAALSSGW